MKNEQGFTLVELLVVVSIVSLLASIAIPQVAEYRDKAKTAELLNYVHNIRSAAHITFYDGGADGLPHIENSDRSAVQALPGMPKIPEYIGAYVNFADFKGSTTHWEFISIQVCHTKLIKDGKATTFRWRHYRRDGIDQTPIHEFLPPSEAMSEEECNTRSQ